MVSKAQLKFGRNRTVTVDADPDDHIGAILHAGNWYEHDLLKDAATRVTQGIAIDAGAHIGVHSLWFARAMGLKVIAFEPHPDTYWELNRNLSLNPTANVTAHGAAVGAATGRGGRIVEPRAGNSGTTKVEYGGGSVAVWALDDFHLRDVTLVKVDVEGNQAAVLKGARGTLEKWSPVVYVEGNRKETQELLPEGYECFGMFGRTATYGFHRVLRLFIQLYNTREGGGP